MFPFGLHQTLITRTLSRGGLITTHYDSFFLYGRDCWTLWSSAISRARMEFSPCTKDSFDLVPIRVTTNAHYSREYSILFLVFAACF